MNEETPAVQARASEEFDDFRKSNKNAEIAQPRRFVVIEHVAFGRDFAVRVVPPLEGENLDAEFSDYRRARGWASGLRLTRGWMIRDLVEGEGHG